MSVPAVGVNLQDRPFAKPPTAAVRILGTLREWLRRKNSRTELSRMTERSLRDLGYSRCDAEAEAQKPFWMS